METLEKLNSIKKTASLLSLVGLESFNIFGNLVKEALDSGFITKEELVKLLGEDKVKRLMSL
jgi:hypothetical protein